MRKVLVRGWIEDHAVDTINGGHHSVPVRFKCEDGSYEWLWVRKDSVALCESKKGKEKK